MNQYLFLICIPIVAFLYSAVGHGGASGYLALMGIFSFAASDVKTVALTLNLFVAGIAFFQYHRSGHFDKKLFVVLAAASIPMAFLGGRIQLDTQIYFYVLGAFLMLASLRLFFYAKKNTAKNHEQYSLPIALLLGASIGFFSGLIGIGGGIILSPVVLMLGWSNPKTTAGISALFIFVNSAAGLLGKYSTGLEYPGSMPLIIILVIVGGLLGAYFGAQKWSNMHIKKLLAVLLFLGAIKIFIAS